MAATIVQDTNEFVEPHTGYYVKRYTITLDATSFTLTDTSWDVIWEANVVNDTADTSSDVYRDTSGTGDVLKGSGFTSGDILKVTVKGTLK